MIWNGRYEFEIRDLGIRRSHNEARGMGAPRSGNPGLAYAFRATPELAIGLDVHYKAPSLRRFFFLNLPHFLSTLFPAARTPFARPHPSQPLPLGLNTLS